MVTNNNVTIDVADLGSGTAIPPFEKGLLEKIDYSIYKKEELLDGIVNLANNRSALHRCSIPSIWFTTLRRARLVSHDLPLGPSYGT